jgi:hypothetical protein
MIKCVPSWFTDRYWHDGILLVPNWLYSVMFADQDSGWIRIQLALWNRIQAGKITNRSNSKEIPCFEVLHVIFGGLKASSVAWKSFVEIYIWLFWNWHFFIDWSLKNLYRDPDSPWCLDLDLMNMDPKYCEFVRFLIIIFIFVQIGPIPGNLEHDVIYNNLRGIFQSRGPVCFMFIHKVSFLRLLLLFIFLWVVGLINSFQFCEMYGDKRRKNY